MTDLAHIPQCAFGCTAPVPLELQPERLCVLHFTLSLEQACAEMRREAVAGKMNAERQAEITRCAAASALTLARVAMGNMRLSDELKKRILSTFLTLMVLRESIDRPRLAEPQAAGPLRVSRLSRTA